jgi:hypothetical protein
LEEAVSQVIVTDDKYREKRQQSRLQEDKITQDARLIKWRRSDISGKDPIAILAGLAFLPVLAVWGGIMAIMMLMLSFLRYLFKGLGLVIGGSKNLIVRDKT